MKRLCWILVMIFSVFAVKAFSKEWNGIVPGVSTRYEAERILGEHKRPDTIGIYKYKKFRVHIFYKRKDRNYPDKDIVQRIKVRPDKIQTLASYIKRLPNFHKDFIKIEIDRKISHIDGRAVYFNATEGFEIWVQQSYETRMEIITSFSYVVPYVPPASSGNSQKN